jgi:hypothetical protein
VHTGHDAAQLDTWAEQLLAATSLTEVFADR